LNQDHVFLALDILSDLFISSSCKPLESIVESTYLKDLKNMNDIIYF